MGKKKRNRGIFMVVNGKRIPNVTVSIFEGWDARGYDTKLHYFVRNRAVCSLLIRYHPPYFDAGFIPSKEEEFDYCKKCVELLMYRIRYVDTRRFII